MINLSYDIRRKWLHYNSLNHETGEFAFYCSQNSILSGNGDENPLISFFTPIYNTGNKLLRTYDSLKNQTYKNWEWVVVNDSNDNITQEIINEISLIDSRVKVFEFLEKSNGVIGEAKWRAASQTNGKWIVELDHDDYLLPDAGKFVIEAFRKYPDAKFVYSDCAEIDENWNSLTYDDGFAFGYRSYRNEKVGSREFKVVNSPNINPKTIRHIVGVPNHLRAWCRLFYHQIGGYNRKLSIADDYELIVRTFLYTRMVRIPKLLYLQFHHQSNTQDKRRSDIQRRVRFISNFYNEKIRDRFSNLSKVDWAWEENPQDPLRTKSRLRDEEGYVNYIYEEVDYTYEEDNKVWGYRI